MKVHLRMSAMSESLLFKTVNFYKQYTAKQRYHQTGEVLRKAYWNWTFWRDVTIRFSRQFVVHVMDVYKFQWTLLVLMSCRNILHPSSGWMNGYGWMLKWWGWMERCQCWKFWEHTGNHSYRRGKTRYDWVLSQQANPAMQGGKTIKFSLHSPVHCCDWTKSLKPSYRTDTCLCFQPIPRHPPGPSQSPWSWRQYIPAKHQK
jgi:hypothetical protein